MRRKQTYAYSPMALLPNRRILCAAAAAITRSPAAATSGGGGGARQLHSRAVGLSTSFVGTPSYRPRGEDGHAAPSSWRKRRATAPDPLVPSTARHLSSSSEDVGRPVLLNRTGERDGLIRHEVVADDGHPLRLYSRPPRPGSGAGTAGPLDGRGRPVLLLHGRTWSSQPVFDLRSSPDDGEGTSTLQSLSDLGYAAYALDLRGFGETPRDGGGYTTPVRCAEDVRCAIDWIADRHAERGRRPALLGWSQGALVAQLYAQRHGSAGVSDLVLFGSIYDPKVVYPRDRPLYGPDAAPSPAPEVANTVESSLEDFTIPGTIDEKAAMEFSNIAMAADPIKAAWGDLHEFNECRPARVEVPTLVVAGAQDPYVSWDAQRDLFEGLGTEDRAMAIIPGCDHPAHILEARGAFVRSVVGFLSRHDGLQVYQSK